MAREDRPEGDPAACQELLVPGPVDTEGLVDRLARCLGQDLQRHAQRRCGNPADAEDAVQDALATALRYLGGFRGETSLRSWLLRLVSTACIHQRRGRRNDPALHSSIDLPEGIGPLLADPHPVAEEKLLVQEKLRAVAAVLGSLTPEERTLLLRHEGDEVPLEVLAAESAQTVAAVRSRLYRVRQRLRGQLDVLLHGDAPSPEAQP
ncbi:MAG: RNA polymerase sigma factor [Myxococcota bacterium]|jgi:RNA polymerase sigma-70 factor (ECF subfamily)|nr:RNA polymerase sigma factor [Myxococcota bacterium]